jgi:hypothetical protein
MSEQAATVTELAQELAQLRKDFLAMREERDEALHEADEARRAAFCADSFRKNAFKELSAKLDQVRLLQELVSDMERQRDEARTVAKDNYCRRKIAHVALWGERSDVFGFRVLEELYPWLREDAS